MTCATLMVACLRGRLRWPARADASIHTHCDQRGVTTLGYRRGEDATNQPRSSPAAADTPRKRKYDMLKGFKDFLMRGNVVDLAIAVVIGGAFGKVIEAFVTVIMDLIGKVFSTPNFSGWVPGGIHLGAFLTVLISFVIVAAAVYFMVVVPMNAIAARRAAGEEAPAAPSEEVTLLTEIRDALNRR